MPFAVMLSEYSITPRFYPDPVGAGASSFVSLRRGILNGSSGATDAMNRDKTVSRQGAWSAEEMKKLGFQRTFRAENRGENLGFPAKVGLKPLFSVCAANPPQPGLIGEKERIAEDL